MIKDKRSKIVFYYIARLQELKKEMKTITYKTIGLETNPPVHFRHVPKHLAYIHAATDVYNKRHGIEVPHITALVVKTATGKPGTGCRTISPLQVFPFDFEPYMEEIKKIVTFMLNPSLDALWNMGYDDMVDVILDLYLKSATWPEQ